MAAKQQPPSDAVKQIHFLAAALKAPRITEARDPPRRPSPRRRLDA